MRIAVLDDEEFQADSVALWMEQAGHYAKAFYTARQLLTELRRETFDLLILDWNLPDMSGLETLRWALDNLVPPPPVLLLTGRTSETDIVNGLNAGADDFVTKPVRPPLLLARVAALLRRAYPDRAVDGREQYGDYEFDLRAETIAIAGEPVVVTAKEFGLAALLFRNTHRALSRAHILEAVWGRNPDLPTRTLDMHVSRVRTKLRLRPENGFRLLPVYSYGYRLERLIDGAIADGAL